MFKNKIIIKEIASLEEMLRQFSLLKQSNPDLTQKNYKRILPLMLESGDRMIGVFDDIK